MKKMIGVFCVCAVFLGAMGSANATVPQLMPVQGMLSDSLGAPIDGLTKLTFNIYDSVTDVTPAWTEIYELGNAVDVQDGFFTVYLGSIDPSGNPLVIDWDAAEQWLGITVAEDVEMPRIRLASVPFASEAAVCRQLGALDEDDADDLAALIDDGCPADTAFRAFDGMGGLICDADDTGAGGTLTAVNGTAPITASTVGGTVTVGVTTGTTAGTVATGNHAHDHGAITGLADDDHTQYFNLSQAETVTGITAFTGGTTGSTAPFTVDSTFVVAGLNADLLDGIHASSFSDAGHDHDADYAPVTHTHDHGAMTGLTDDDHTQYFNLSQAETVTGRPAFNGGTSGTSSPFTVDSSQVVTLLNCDYLDGFTGTSYATATHVHDTVTIVSTSDSIAAGAYDTELETCPSGYPIVVSCGVDVENVNYMFTTALGPTISGMRALNATDGTYTTTANGCYVGVRNTSPTSAYVFKVIMVCRAG